MLKSLFNFLFPEPSPAQMRLAQLSAAERALVAAEADAEVANATVLMLKARIQRLKNHRDE